MVALSPSSWAPGLLGQLWVSYTSVLLGLELEAGMGLLGIRAKALGPGPTPAWPLPPIPECPVLVFQNLVLYRLRDIRHEPGSNELDAQGHVLGAGDKG